MDFMLNMFLVIVLVSLFNLGRYAFKIRKVMKMHQNDPNIQGISIVNGEIKVIEKNVNTAEPIKELVNDTICGKELEKKDTYRVFKDEKEYFFCSWECREKFLEQYTKEEGPIQ